MGHKAPSAGTHTGSNAPRTAIHRFKKIPRNVKSVTSYSANVSYIRAGSASIKRI
jgi:hypothetical protein